PLTSFVAIDSRSFTADTTNLVLDVPTIDVSGAITLNGATPTNGPSCGVDDYETARVTFVEIADGYMFTASSTCTDDHTFGPTQLFPGIYKVSVRGVYTDTTDLPLTSFVALSRLEVR
nr:hypothetical protein [Myxococcales bacterium]